MTVLISPARIVGAFLVTLAMVTWYVITIRPSSTAESLNAIATQLLLVVVIGMLLRLLQRLDAIERRLSARP